MAGLAAPTMRAAAPPRRARPPEFSKSIRDVFFPDAREKLVGPRPQAATPGTKSTADTRPTDPVSQPPAAGDGWSKWITAEVVEDEIKAGQIALAAAVQNPTAFKGGEYEQARENLSLIAVMFGIVAEYDGDIRWRREAAAARDVVARAGFNCKVGTDASYNEAKRRSEDLQTLVRGGSVSLPQPAADVNWSKVAGRPPLMKRLEQAYQQAVAPLTGSANEFERHADRLAHEAQVIAVLSEVITREGYEFADDETYVEYTRAMQNAALSLREAALRQDYQQARKAKGMLSKACIQCHDGYRS